MNVHHLVKSLNSLCKELNKTYYINSGGCCYVAYLIATHLERLRIKYTLIVISKHKKNTYEINNEVYYIKSNKREVDSVSKSNTCSHYYLYIKDVGSINKGTFSHRKYVIDDISSINIRWIYKTGKWNNLYNRESNKYVKTEINNFFKPYEKEQ